MHKKILVFIEETGDKRSLDTLALRRKIRKQARQHTICKNFSVHPIILSKEVQKAASIRASQHDSQKESSSSTRSNAEINKQATSWMSRLYWPMRATDYERARITYKIDILHLSRFVGVHISKGSLDVVQSSEALKVYLSTPRQASYLEFIPGIYQHSPIIRGAVNCVLARTSSLLFNNMAEHQVLSLYGAALDNLQTAIGDPEQRLNFDTLCATAILQMYELLGDSTSERYSYHTQGLMRLMSMYDPTRFNSEYLISLFMSQRCTMIAESIVQGVDCFLEKPEWRSLVAGPDFPQLTEIIHTQIRTGRYIRQTRELLIDPTPDLENFTWLVRELQYGLTQIPRWIGEIDELEHQFATPGAMNEARSFIWSIQLTLSRLLVALDPLSFQAVILEFYAQFAAQQILHLFEKLLSNPQSPTDTLPLLSVIRARGAVATSQDWQAMILEGKFVNGLGRMELEKFEVWRSTEAYKGATRRERASA